MLVQLITNFGDLQPYRQSWNRLADDCLFRSWDWLSTWWQHYSAGKQLHVLLVFEEEPKASCQSERTCSSAEVDAERLIGILPCYLETCFARGRVLRLLGDGEVCTDHLDLLTSAENCEQVANSLAKYLIKTADSWDTTAFTAIGTDCTGLMQLSQALSALNCQVSEKPNASRWSIALPEDWEGYLAMQSKSHRKNCLLYTSPSPRDS